MKNPSRDQLFNEWYDKAQQKLQSARETHTANQAHLESIGFQVDQTKKMAGRTFYFDYQKRLTAFEMYCFDERHLAMTMKKDGVAIFGSGNSFCSAITVFPDDKIIECVLLQDDTVVKKSEGSAALAGVKIPYFGSLQGTAKTGSNEHESGILTVRLTIEDIRTPSVIFRITGGADKSSEAYGKAFEQAQELFGFFDGIARMNLNAKEKAAAPEKAPSAAAPPAQTAQAEPAQEIKSDPKESDADENIFDTIRELGKLRDEGLLTEEEFSAKKKYLMEKL
jgi:hypothetical protein